MKLKIEPKRSIPVSLFIISLCLIFAAKISPLEDVSSSAESPSKPQWQAVGIYSHPPIRESSGVAASRQFKGVYWTLNDSGNPPVLYATTLKGDLIREFLVEGATNFDWEDLALDDKGQLWIGDIGDNLRIRKNLTVYVVMEPNPYKDKEVKAIAQYSFRYPDDDRFDAEGMFVFNELPYIVSKEEQKAVLYHSTTLNPSQVNVLKRAGQLAEARLVTGADISADGKLVAVCTYNRVWVYESRDDAKVRSEDYISGLVGNQPKNFSNDFRSEAVGFDGYDLILTSENRNIYLLPKWW